MHHFCTYFDHHYLPRGLALYRSLRRHCPSFKLWVLCMDRASYDVLSRLGLSDIHLIGLGEFERGDEPLLTAKQNRTLIEYYFTCTPSLPLYIFNTHPKVDIITYLDADLFFFEDPAPLFDELGHSSIAIVEHRFSPHLGDFECFGIYNVSWLSFRRDDRSFACLHWWRERCIEWCYDRCEDGRFADQKYLDSWPSRFEGVVVLRHKGANLGPWNLANYTIRGDEDRLWVDEQPLIFFHFHGLKQMNALLYDTNLSHYGVRPSACIRRRIYGLYIRTLLDVTREVSPMMPHNVSWKSARGLPEPKSLSSVAVRRLRRLVPLSRDLLAWRFLPVINGRVF